MTAAFRGTVVLGVFCGWLLAHFRPEWVQNHLLP